MVYNKKIYLEEINAGKDIGVVFDPNFNFRPHMEEIYKKTNRPRYDWNMMEIYKIINIYEPKVASEIIQLNKKSTRGSPI